MKNFLIALLIFSGITKASDFDIKDIFDASANISIHTHLKVDAKSQKFTVLMVEEESSSINLKKIEGVNVTLHDKTNSLVCSASLENNSSIKKENDANKFHSLFLVFFSNEMIENSEIELRIKDGKSEFPKHVKIKISYLVKNNIINSKLPIISETNQ